MTSETGEPESFLCWCNEVPRAAYVAALRETPDADLYKVARQCNVGTKCTSCLSDVEAVYLEARRSLAGERHSVRRAAARRLPLRGRLWQVLDHLSPQVGYRGRHRAPILRGPGVRTIVSIVNAVTEPVRDRSATARVDALVRDASGRAVHRSRVVLEPGQRLDLAASDHLTDDGDALTTGTVLLDVRSIGDGVVGTLRPHVTMVGPKGVGSVHTQGAVGDLSAFHLTARGSPGERQFIIVMDCAGHDGRVEACVNDAASGDITAKATIGVTRDGAALWAVPVGVGRFDALLSLRLTADRRFKAYYGVASPNLDRIALDHL